MPEDSSEDSPESPFAGWPSSSSEADAFQHQHDDPFGFGKPSEPSETVELYRTVSFLPLSVVLLGLALLLQVFAVPSSLGLFVALLAIASVAVSIVGVRRSQALPEEDAETEREDS